MKPTYVPVSSSNIRAVAYANGAGYVEFLSGKRFAYEMPRKMFDELKEPTKPLTVGKFFAKSVKGHCRVVWVGRRCSNSPCPEDATLRGESAGNEFFLCPTCSKIARFAAITFTPLETEQR